MQKKNTFSFHFRVKVPSREAKKYKENSSPPNDEPEFLFAFRLFFD